MNRNEGDEQIHLELNPFLRQMKPLQQCFHMSFSIVRKYNQEFLLNLRWVTFFGVKVEFPVHISKVLKTSEKKIGRFFQRLFRWWQIRIFIKPLKKALNSAQPLLWLTTQVHTTYSVSFKQESVLQSCLCSFKATAQVFFPYCLSWGWDSKGSWINCFTSMFFLWSSTSLSSASCNWETASWNV